MVIGNSEAISLAVQEGIGVAFLSHLVVSSPLARGELKLVRIPKLKLSQEIWIGRNIHRAATQAPTAFWEFIHESDNELVNSLVNQSEELVY